MESFDTFLCAFQKQINISVNDSEILAFGDILRDIHP